MFIISSRTSSRSIFINNLTDEKTASTWIWWWNFFKSFHWITLVFFSCLYPSFFFHFVLWFHFVFILLHIRSVHPSNSLASYPQIWNSTASAVSQCQMKRAINKTITRSNCHYAFLSISIIFSTFPLSDQESVLSLLILPLPTQHPILKWPTGITTALMDPVTSNLSF